MDTEPVYISVMAHLGRGCLVGSSCELKFRFLALRFSLCVGRFLLVGLRWIGALTAGLSCSPKTRLALVACDDDREQVFPYELRYGRF